MKTDELIDMLARQAAPVDRSVMRLRFYGAVVLGLAGTGVLALLLLGRRADLATAIQLPLYWAKVLFAASMAAGALLVTRRLATPGRVVGMGWAGVLVPLLLVISAAITALALAPQALRGELIRGETWLVCPFLIALLSAPALVSVLRAIRGMAPTRLRLAGAAGGLLAGALATMAYCVHCPEMAVPFWAVWYTAGMLIPAGVGAIVGPRALRW